MLKVLLNDFDRSFLNSLLFGVMNDFENPLANTHVLSKLIHLKGFRCVLGSQLLDLLFIIVRAVFFKIDEEVGERSFRDTSRTHGLKFISELDEGCSDKLMITVESSDYLLHYL